MIIAICPGDYVTGGPEALHQLVDMANHVLPGSAAICYWPFEESFEKNEAFKSYNAPIIQRNKIPADAVIVIPEVLPYLVLEFEQRCVLWWLSVDNFLDVYRGLLNLFDLHVTQSTYASNEVKALFHLPSIMLSDYINSEFQSIGQRSKNKTIAVNPSKGIDLIERFRSLNPEISVVILENLSRIEVRELLLSAMAYIDFGHHPGKDRLPREATLQNAIVFARRAGAAQLFADLQLPDEYLFDDLSDLSLKIDKLFEQYPLHVERQQLYREHVGNQKNIFMQEVTQFLDVCQTLAVEDYCVQQKMEVRRLSQERLGSKFYCPICGEVAQKLPANREDSACQCGASWRVQAGMLAILEGLGYFEDVKPGDIESDLSRIGLGISDNWMLARRISNVFSYTNSFYYQFPIVDLLNPPASAIGFFDFVSCSDVLQDIKPPSEDALAGIFNVLKPGGFAVISVPVSGLAESEEYYPALKSWWIQGSTLHWVDKFGVEHLDAKREYRDGIGQTPTFRLWSHKDLIRQCRKVGFIDVFPPLNLPPLVAEEGNPSLNGLIIARRPSA